MAEPTVVAPVETASKRRGLKLSGSGNLRQYGMMGALLLLMVLFTWLTDGLFVQPRNITLLLVQNGYVLILAIGIAPTATLMPFVYTQIAAAAGFGWVVFRTLPDAWGWVGMAVITACGATSAWLNVRHASRTRRPDSAVSADAVVE